DTKNEFEKWNAYNIDISQTAFDDRLAVNLIYDRQQYKRGGEALIPNPTISIDVLKNFQDLKANPNFSRPFVTAGPGRGNSTETDRKYIRGSLFGELRSADFFDKDSLLVKILGKHRFNGVYSKEDYTVETRAWDMYGHTQAWDAYWLRTDGSVAGGRAPAAVIYLGQALGGYDSAHNAELSGITVPVTYQSGGLYYFDATWRPTSSTVGFSDPWVALGSVPSALAPMFTTTTSGLPNGQTALLQNSNPANYVGWGTNYAMSVNRYDNGANPSLLTGAARTYRITKSYAGSWQGYLWNESIIPTAGWRYDEVKSKGVVALPQNNLRGTMNLGHDTVNPLNPTQKVYGYDFASDYTSYGNKSGSIYKDHSTSGGVVVHLNKILGKHDFLPINVSLSYNKSSNFQVTDTRRNIYGAIIGNPTGSTKDYGLTLSTKDNKYSFRAIKYETALFNADSNLDASGLTQAIKLGLNWRNVILYQISSGYAMNFAGINHNRNEWKPVYVDSTGRGVRPSTWTPVDPTWHLQTQAESDTMRDNTIRAWNDVQKWLESRGYFAAWNYTPATSSVLTDRTTYLANPTAYTPDSATVYNYTANTPALQGFKVTADTQSEGYEFELVANPLPNWRVAFNASKTTAIRNNVGGPEIVELVSYMTNAMAGAAGDLRMYNASFDDPTNVIWNNGNWTGFRGQYMLMKLQEGAAASELRKWRYNVVSNYSFTKGFLKGVGVGASYRWQDKVIIGYPVVAVSERDFSYDLASPYYGRAEDALDLWLSYERKLTSKLGWKIQLNVRNVLQNNGVIPISVQPDGQTWAAVRTKPVQEWFVTNTLTF
ncbi:MAG: TonB-dependent receptor, partial [Verrucomicrobia bacterium]|nr:TonB-dependent receptor [Verrucomicrobiota bacterium]